MKRFKIPSTLEAILIGAALMGVVAFFRPQDVMVAGWKILLTIMGAVLAHRFYQLVYRNRPEETALTPPERAAALVALAVIIHAFVTGVTSGL